MYDLSTQKKLNDEAAKREQAASRAVIRAKIAALPDPHGLLKIPPTFEDLYQRGIRIS